MRSKSTIPFQLKIGFVILIIAAISGLINKCIAQDIRNCNWGDTIEKVKASEGEKKFESLVTDGINIEYFTGKVGELEAYIAFLFIDDKLFRVRYIFSEDHSDDESYVTDFYQIKKILDDKYGAKKADMTWLNDLYQDDVNKRGFAVSAGHLIIMTRRENEKTSIDHILSGDNFKVKHMLEYNSKDYAHLFENKKKQKNTKDF